MIDKAIRKELKQNLKIWLITKCIGSIVLCFTKRLIQKGNEVLNINNINNYNNQNVNYERIARGSIINSLEDVIEIFHKKIVFKVLI